MGHILIPHIFSRPKLIDLISKNPCSEPIGTIPSFSVNKNGTNQTGIVTDTSTKLTWSTELYDYNSNFADDKFTPQASGEYLFVIKALIISLATDKRLMAQLYKNGSPIAQALNRTPSINDLTSTLVTTAEANGTTDYFEAYILHSNGSNATIEGSTLKTTFSGFRIIR